MTGSVLDMVNLNPIDNFTSCSLQYFIIASWCISLIVLVFFIIKKNNKRKFTLLVSLLADLFEFILILIWYSLWFKRNHELVGQTQLFQALAFYKYLLIFIFLWCFISRFRIYLINIFSRTINAD
jgi:glycosyltransferase involved in cell wall biosynthesis